MKDKPAFSPEPAARQRPSWIEAAAVFLLFCALSVAMTWPLASNLRHFVSDPGDPYLNIWILDWDWKALFHHPLSLFDANIFFPARLALAFSENLLGAAVFGFPLFAAGIPPLEVYNVVFLLGMAISGLGAWALAEELTGDSLASLLAGAAYAFVPFRLDQLPHVQMQWGGFLPLFLLFLFRFFESRRTRDLVLFGVFFVANALASIYFGFFGTLALAVTGILEISRRHLWRDRELRRSLSIALIACGAVLAPIVAPYALASHVYRFRRGVGELAAFSASPGSFLSAGFRNKLLGALTARFAHPEAQLYPGAVLVAFAAAGLWFNRRRSEASRAQTPTRRKAPPALDLLIGALIALRLAFAVFGPIRIRGVISMGEPYRLSMMLFMLIVARCAIAFPKFVPFGNIRGALQAAMRWPPIAVWGTAMTITGIVVAIGGRMFLYRELFEMFRFVFGAVRGAARGIVLAHLGLGALAAAGLSSIRKRSGRFGQIALPVFALAAALFEYRAAPLDLFRSDAEPTPVTRWLASRSFRGGVLELPMKLEDNFEYVYRVTQHDHPILNGYSGFFPKAFLELQKRFDSNPVAPGTMNQIRKMGARIVIFHADRATDEELVSIVNFLKEGKRSGNLRPAAYFRDRRDTSIVLEVPSPAPIATAAEAAAANERIDAFLADPGESTRPPYGWFDGPSSGSVIHGSQIVGSGWAASDSGMDRIEISLDGRVVGRATYGFPRPDVIAAKPHVPCKATCGYRYRIQDVPPGKHTLSTRFVGKNGKDVTLPPAEIRLRP